MTVATPATTAQQNNSNSNSNSSNSNDDAGTQEAMRGAKRLVGAYAGVSVLTLAAIVLLRNHPGLVNSAVWIRGTIVVASSLLSLSFAVRAARGSARALLRLRIVSAVMVAAIAAIIALPGTFPVWMKIDQGVCGALLIGVVALVNGRRVRAQFAGR
jgi:hypothetical protein